MAKVFREKCLNRLYKMEDITFVKMRYTLPNGLLGDWSELVKSLVPVLRVHDICTAGYEDRNKLGRDTHPHIHVHFNTKDEVKNIRERVKTWMKKRGDERTKEGNAGCENKAYSLGTPKENEGLRSVERFARYPWKQRHRIQFLGEKVPEGWDADEIQFQIERASAEYALNAENRVKAEEKAKEKAANSTYAKIKSACDENHPKTFHDVIEVAIDVYVKYEIAMNMQTMAGYCLTYAVSKGMVSKHQICDKIFGLTGVNGHVGNHQYKTYEDVKETALLERQQRIYEAMENPPSDEDYSDDDY